MIYPPGIQLGAGGVRPARERIAVVGGVHITLLRLPAMGDYSIVSSFFFFFFFIFFFVSVDVAALAISLEGERLERRRR
jgi:hypothetical protein